MSFWMFRPQRQYPVPSLNSCNVRRFSDHFFYHTTPTSICPLVLLPKLTFLLLLISNTNSAILLTPTGNWVRELMQPHKDKNGWRDWKVGGKLSVHRTQSLCSLTRLSFVGDCAYFDLWVNSVRQVYEIMISGIVPRPIAFVSSVSEDGVGNLGCFRYDSKVHSQAV